MPPVRNSPPNADEATDQHRLLEVLDEDDVILNLKQHSKSPVPDDGLAAMVKIPLLH